MRMLPLVLASLSCFIRAVEAATNSAPPKPNIIVILADDWGYADLGVQGQEKDVRTPNLDRMAAEGVRCTAGYITAPQCSPSRAGLITGRYQQRFGIDTIPDCPMPLEQVTIAERLKPAGYTSGMVGKWHLDPNALCTAWAAKNLPNQKPNAAGRVAVPEAQRQRYLPKAQGFDDYFCGELTQFFANFDLAGKDLPPRWVKDERFRVDVQTDAALAFLKRNQDKPFFLYLCYYAPHTPLELPPTHAGQFTNEMALRRRAALAMMAGVDHGVGRIFAALKEHGIDQNTLVFFTSDNGAPVHGRRDSPLDKDMGGWDGSLNTPWVGEKGMLSEGGIRVPFVLRWPGILPAGKVYSQPVSSLDIAATANALGGLPADKQLDGVNLIPFLAGRGTGVPHGALYWRFWSQAALREGRWKLLSNAQEPDKLFDLESDEHERHDLASGNPDKVAALRRKLEAWAMELEPKGMPGAKLNDQERGWYREYFTNQAARSTKP